MPKANCRSTTGSNTSRRNWSTSSPPKPESPSPSTPMTATRRCWPSLKAGKLGQYDVAVPGDFMVQIMARRRACWTPSPRRRCRTSPISPRNGWTCRLIRAANLRSPISGARPSFAVNRDVYKGDISSLGIIFNPPDELKGKINVLDSQNEVLSLARCILASRNAPPTATS